MSLPDSRIQQEKELIGQLFADKKGRTAKAIFFITLKAAPVWLVPVVIARIIDLGDEETPSVSELLLYVSIGAFLYLQNLPAAIAYMNNLVHITRGIGQDLRIKICKQLQALSLCYHSRNSVGSLHTKAIRDIEILEQMPKLVIEQGYTFLFGITVSSIAIAYRKPEALIFFAVVVPVAAIISGIFRKRMSNSVNDYRKSMEGMSTHLNEMVSLLPVTRAHGLEEHQLRNVTTGIVGVFKKGVRFDKLTQLFAATSWVALGVMQILFLGGSMYACFQGEITVGDVVMFNSFFVTLSNSLSNFLVVVPQVFQTRESLDSVIEILRAPDLETNNGKPTFPNIRGSFRFENVSFSYGEANTPVIADLSLEVPPGTSLAITGPSGSGKSTLLSLVIGFIHPVQGKVLLDGKNIAEMDLRSYRRSVGVVSQDPVFFSGSIRENVAYGNESLSDEKIWNALQQAHAHEFVESLPQGLNTRIGIEGTRLSGGQMQRLAIARAIVRAPQVLILDEATSALDTESERHVQAALENVMQGRTTFIVAHRISTVENADRVAILEAGHLVACDTPQNLLKSDNFFSRALKSSQAAD
ncbi:ABC transporter ATP-binding protein [Pelagicoccus sp. SDUM812005]|uniref:ABC transporter ATP-binding protein n=1 Tax=Pelagicoccus sp. SDUM812005 TaxID=3041257 RepID=UPI00280D3DA4|nr:ABC transporter ATP-binding protein [Pelagicoccus sp. SDUM812005]MDQ8181585.1 ABC transporter ATP-binding protein [Pelagicoccus sp. SDUM812005]